MLNNCYLGVIAANDAQPVHQLIKPIPIQIGFIRHNKKKKSEIRFYQSPSGAHACKYKLDVQQKSP